MGHRAHESLNLGTSYFWDKEKSEWRNFIRSEKEYDDQHRYTSYIDYMWNLSQETWEPYWKGEIAYHEIRKQEISGKL